MDQEKRKSTRYPFVEQVTLITLKERSYISQSENLSMSGMYLVRDNPLPPGTEGLLSMIVKMENSKKNISSRFSVVHNNVNEKGQQGMGIKFTGMSAEDRDLLMMIIDETR